MRTLPRRWLPGAFALLLLTLLLLIGCHITPQATSAPEWDKYVADYLEAYFAVHPDGAIGAGRHEFDGKLPDFNSAAIDKEVARLHAARTRVENFAGTLDQRQQFEREYVLWAIDSDLFWLETARWPYRSPSFYSGAVDPQVYLTRPYSPLDQRMRAFINYEHALPNALQQIRANLTVRAAVDAQGKVTAWDFLDRSFPWTDAAKGPLLASRQVGMKPTDPGFNNGARAAGEMYDFDHQKIVALNLPWQTEGPIPLRTSNLRSPGEPQRCFASECFMDEIASALHVDPVQFRLRYLGDERLRAVLIAATQKAGWQERPSPAPDSSGSKAVGRGVAVAGHEPRTVVATVAEVEVDRSTGKVLVKRITVAHDCGLIQGVSRTLLEEVQYDASGVTSLDWRTYPVLTFAEVPDIDIVLINHTDMEPLGAGEEGIVPVPAAIGNAIFDAIGVRLRDVPLTPQRVLDSLKNAASPGQRA